MTATAPRTAQELIDRLRQTHFDKPKDRDDLITAVRRMGVRLAGRRGVDTDDALPHFDITDIDALDYELVEMRAEALSNGDVTTKAYISRFRKALKAGELPMPDGRGHIELSASWKRVVSAATKLDPLGIMAFAKWANNRELDPSEVDDETLRHFSEQHLRTRIHKSAIQVVRRTVNVWNQLAQDFELNSVSHPIAYADRGRYVYEEHEFSVTVQKELAYFTERLVLEPPREGRPISASVATQYSYILRQTLSAWCRATNMDPRSIKSALELCNVDNLTIALEFMIVRKEQVDSMAPKSPGSYHACRIVRDFSSYHLPDCHPFRVAVVDMVTSLHTGKKVERDSQGRRKRSPQSRSGQPKRLTRAREDLLLFFADEANAKKLLGLPARLYVSLQTQSVVKREELTILADGCALELMLSTNAWPSELVSLRIPDVEFEIKGYSEIGIVRLTDRDVFQLVGDSCVVVKAYLELVRPQRRGADQGWLFPGRFGVRRPPNSLGNSIRALISDEFKRTIAPSDLQKIVAFVYALHAPDGQAVIEKYLGLRPDADHPLINSWRAIREALRIDRAVVGSKSSIEEDE